MGNDNMTQQTDFLQPLLDLMNKRMDGLEQKIDQNNSAMNGRVDDLARKLDTNTSTTDEILEQAKHTNGRVTKAEKKIEELLDTRGVRRFKIDPNSNLFHLIVLGFVLVLVIIASLLQVDVKGIVSGIL